MRPYLKRPLEIRDAKSKQGEESIVSFDFIFEAFNCIRNVLFADDISEVRVGFPKGLL